MYVGYLFLMLILFVIFSGGATSMNAEKVQRFTSEGNFAVAGET